MVNQKLKLYSDHSRHWQTNKYVYPVISRRSKGLSIGVNLNPDTVCNFDCIYCCVDRTDRAQPPAVKEVDLTVLSDELDHMISLAGNGEIFKTPPFDATPVPMQRINDIAFSGDGEPTSYPLFPQACRLVADMLDKHHRNDIKIVVITNATLLARPAIVTALEYLDAHQGEIWAKLDAGTQEYYQLVERTSIPLSRVLDNILHAGRIRPIVIQSLFMKIHGQSPSPLEIDAYINRLSDLNHAGCQIKGVQIYTVARQVAEAYVTPIGDDEVDAIVQRVKHIGLHAEGFYGPQ